MFEDTKKKIAATQDKIKAAKKLVVRKAKKKAKEAWEETKDTVKNVAPAAAIAAASLAPTSANAQTNNGSGNGNSAANAQALNYIYAHNHDFHFQATDGHEASSASSVSSNSGNQGRTYTTTAADYQQAGTYQVAQDPSIAGFIAQYPRIGEWLSRHPGWVIAPEYLGCINPFPFSQGRPRQNPTTGFVCVVQDIENPESLKILPADPINEASWIQNRSRSALQKDRNFLPGGFGYGYGSGGHINVSAGRNGVGVSVGGVGRNGAGGASVRVGRNGASVSVGGVGRRGAGRATVAVTRNGGILIDVGGSR